MRFFLKSRVKCFSSHSMCIHMIICIWKCPCKSVYVSERAVVRVSGWFHLFMYNHLYIYTCQHGCANVSPFASLHVPLSVYPFLLSLCSLCVHPVFLWMSPHSFCTQVPRVCMYVSCCQWMHLCVLHARPCEHSSWYVWDL